MVSRYPRMMTDIFLGHNADSPFFKSTKDKDDEECDDSINFELHSYRPIESDKDFYKLVKNRLEIIFAISFLNYVCLVLYLLFK